MSTAHENAPGGGSLADLVRAAMDAKGYTSMNALEVASGGELRRSTVQRILSGQATVRPETIDALHRHLGIRRAKVLEVLGHASPADVPAGAFVLPEYASLLTRRERRVVLDMVSALLAARGVDVDRR